MATTDIAWVNLMSEDEGNLNDTVLFRLTKEGFLFDFICEVLKLVQSSRLKTNSKWTSSQ